jgi:hypothetical protein
MTNSKRTAKCCDVQLALNFLLSSRRRRRSSLVSLGVFAQKTQIKTRNTETKQQKKSTLIKMSLKKTFSSPFVCVQKMLNRKHPAERVRQGNS